MRTLIAVVILWLLSACSQIQQMSAYNVTEADIEQMLRQQVPKLTHQANVAGIPLKLAVDSMKVDIGPDNTRVIRLNTAASAALSLFGLSYPASLQLQVEGEPYYNASEKAVYLRSVKLLNSEIEASGYRGNLSPVSNELLQLINNYLATNPVYRLDTTNPTVKLITTLPLNMAVRSGKISFIAEKQ